MKKNENNENQNRQVTEAVAVLGPVRLSYLKVWKPSLNKLRKSPQNPLGTYEFSTVGLIPKTASSFCSNGEKTVELFRENCLAALKRDIGHVPAKWRNPLHDGDLETKDDEGGDAKYPGFWFFNARADDLHKPGLADLQGSIPSGPTEWDSGDWGRLKLNFYGFTNEFGQGVGIGLLAIQFTDHDEKFVAQHNNMEGF